MSQPAANQPKIQAVLFDYGGVLARVPEDTARQRLADRCGVKVQTLRRLLFGGDSFHLALLGEVSAEKHWSTAARLLRVPPVEMSDFIHEIWQADVLDEDLLSLIRRLRGRCKVGLLSNATSDLRPVLAARGGILETFDDLVISSEVGLIKPDERIYRLAVQRLGVPPEAALMVDDLQQNLLGAQRAGLQGLLYREPRTGLPDLKKLLEG
jgi:putative hydrolase of the HAD superfamily